MSRILAIFGATGTQGGSLLQYVLADPELSKQYKIRAITRDVNSANATKLKAQVEVVRGDIGDRASLSTALAGAHTVFAMTTPVFGPNGREDEFNNAKTMADVAIEQGVEYFIFSSLPAVGQISNNKYPAITMFNAKADAEQYIRSLPIKSAFYCPGSFMENFNSQSFLGPRKQADGTYVLERNHAETMKFPLLEAAKDTGAFVGAILADPDQYKGKRFCAAERHYDFAEITSAMSKASGKTIKFKQVPAEKLTKGLPEGWGDLMTQYFSYVEEYGYWGPGSEELATWAAENARGRLTTLEEYFEKSPPIVEA